MLTAGGDARVALTTLELAAAMACSRRRGRSDAVTLDAVREASPTRILPYDKTGDVHYDVISAFIKSMRGSDPDAAVYWLARMIHGGEDPKFIARRMLIFASEDVGNADPRALLVAHAAFKAAESIGWPECRINLAQAAVYLALAPKSNAVVRGRSTPRSPRCATGPARAVPNHLRDRHRPGRRRVRPVPVPARLRGRRASSSATCPTGWTRGAFFSASPRGWEAEQRRAPRAHSRAGRAGSGARPVESDHVGIAADSTVVGRHVRHALCYTDGVRRSACRGGSVSRYDRSARACCSSLASALCGVAIWALIEAVKTARSAQLLADDLDARLVPLLDKADVTVDAINAELLRIDEIVTRVEEVTDRVDEHLAHGARGRQRARRDRHRPRRPGPAGVEDSQAAAARTRPMIRAPMNPTTRRGGAR